MAKIVLKFQIPKEKQHLLIQTMQDKHVEHTHIHSQYFDNDYFELSSQNVALKQQFKNQRWSQTLYLPTAYQLASTKFQTNLGTTQPPKVNIQQYQQHKKINPIAKERLKECLRVLKIQFEAKFERFSSTFQINETQIAVHLDVGFFNIQTQHHDFTEIQFKLIQGDFKTFIDFILPRLQRYSLWFDCRNKAQICYALAQNQRVQVQTKLQLKTKNKTEHAIQHMLDNTLQHLLPNSSAIASGHFNDEHVHQARVAIRRIRSILKTFSKWSKHIDATWETKFANIFRQLGTQRDLDMIENSILPQLEQVKCPKITLPMRENLHTHPLPHVFQSYAFNNLILSVLQFIHTPHQKKSKSDLKHQFKQDIQKLHHQIIRDAHDFLDFSIDERHATRKRLKRLRYSIECIASLYPKAQVEQYLKILKPAQETLGLYNDVLVAEALFQTLHADQPNILFALGWLKARQDSLVCDAVTELRRLANTVPFWS